MMTKKNDYRSNTCNNMGPTWHAIKIDTEDNFADPETKSLIVKAWYRHLCYNNNLNVSIPDQ